MAPHISAGLPIQIFAWGGTSGDNGPMGGGRLGVEKGYNAMKYWAAIKVSPAQTTGSR